MTDFLEGSRFDRCETPNVIAPETVTQPKVTQQAAPGNVSKRELSDRYSIVRIKRTGCRWWATSRVVRGSRLLHHVEPRRNFLRDHARGLAMVKSGSPPGAGRERPQFVICHLSFVILPPSRLP
jgi:hypothetical protein